MVILYQQQFSFCPDSFRLTTGRTFFGNDALYKHDSELGPKSGRHPENCPAD
jgi:hypothetical protein